MHLVFWVKLNCFFWPSLCRSTSGEHYRNPPIQNYNCKLFLPPTPDRRYCNDTDHLLSSHNNLPWGHLLYWSLFRVDLMPFAAFLVFQILLRIYKLDSIYTYHKLAAVKSCLNCYILKPSLSIDRQA